MDDISPKRTGTIRARPNQWDILVGTMIENPFLNGAKLTSSYTCHRRNEDWEKLCAKLNSSGGAIKSVKAWQKSWSDKKVEVNKKHRLYKDALMKNGAGQCEIYLTPREKKILSLIGQDALDGLNIPESESLSEEYQTKETETPVGSNHESECLLNVKLEPMIFLPSPSTLPDTERTTSENHSPAATTPNNKSENHSTAASTPNNKSEDPRLSSLRRRSRTKPVILKSENAQKLIDGQREIGLAIHRSAEAAERRAAAEERRNELIEESLALKKRKLDILEGLLNILKRNSE